MGLRPRVLGKWLTSILGVLVLAALLVLWWEMRSDGQSVAAPAPLRIAPAPAFAAPAPSPIAAAAPAPAPAPAPPPPTEAAAEAPAKIDTQSDAFFYQFDEVVPAKLTREAATCYEGARHVHRNQMLKLAFKTHIVGGEVTVSDVKVMESTLDYPGLEDCFVRKVTAAHWHNDALPDWSQDDELVIRPERGMKKFWRSNLEDEGDGPIGPAVMKPGQQPNVNAAH